MKKSKLLTLLVLVLAVCTVVGMMAFSASAAEADHPHTADTTHCACGGFGAVEGSGHTECAEETWTAWTNGMTSPTAGNYYLAEDVTITTAITLSGDFKLCLNGYTLTCDGSRLFTHVVNGYRALDICDCSQGRPVRSPVIMLPIRAALFTSAEVESICSAVHWSRRLLPALQMVVSSAWAMALIRII